MRAYHQSRGEGARDVVLIPASAHGTNPASAIMAGFKVVVVATDANGNVDVADLKKKAEEHAKDLAGADDHVSLDARRVRGCDPRHLRHHSRVRRPGLHGRRQHERAGRADQPGDDRRRRVPPQPAQDVRDPARRRRSRHGSDRRGETPRAVPAGPSAGRRTVRRAQTRRSGDSAGVRGAVGQREHPADLVRLHPHAGRRRRDRRHASSRSSTPTTSSRGSRSTTTCSTRARTAASRTR